MAIINPLLTKGRFLFVINGCGHCQMYKNFIRLFNSQLKANKRIVIIDCTSYNVHGILDNQIIKLFENRFDGFPTLFIDGSIKSGSNTEVELKSWLDSRLADDFEFPKEPEYLPTLGSYATFDKHCGYHKGRLICN